MDAQVKGVQAAALITAYVTSDAQIKRLVVCGFKIRTIIGCGEKGLGRVCGVRVAQDEPS